MAWRRKAGEASWRPRARAILPRWITWLSVAIPVFFFVFGSLHLAGAIKFVAGAEQARGEVISVESRRDSEGDVTYKPTIRYQRSDGRVFEAETYMSSSGYDFDRGHQVDILYSHVDPYEVRINTFFSLYGLGLIFGSFGAGFLGILLWQRRKRAGRTTVEEMVEVVAERVQDEASEERGTRTTDPSKPGHAHEPKPKHTPTIRRMR